MTNVISFESKRRSKGVEPTDQVLHKVLIHYFDMDDDGHPFVCTDLAWNMTELEIAQRMLELHLAGHDIVGPINIFRFDHAMTLKYTGGE